LSKLSQDQIAEFKQFGDRVSRDTSVITSIASDATEAQELAARLSSAVARSERADATFATRTAFAERLSAAKDKGEAISVDMAQDPHNIEMFLRYAEQYGGDSAAALSMFDAELARQGLKPNRVFSDGTAMPGSFDDVRDLHQRQSNDPALSPDLTSNNAANRAKAAQAQSSTTSPPSLVPSSPIRDEVREQGESIKQQAAEASPQFEAKAGIVKTEDGTLATEKSLLGTSANQVKNDAATTATAMKNAVKDLLRKDR